LGAALIEHGVAHNPLHNAEHHPFGIFFFKQKTAYEITTGELDDDRLSSNVPLLNASNVFGAGRQTITMTSTGNRDGLGLQRLNAPEDNQSWYHSVLSDGAYRVQPASDDFATLGAASIQIFRSDLDTTEIELNADLLDFNGNADISGTLVVGGAITGNGSGLTSLNASNLSSGTVPGARLGGNQTMAGNKTFSGNVTIGGVVRAG